MRRIYEQIGPATAVVLDAPGPRGHSEAVIYYVAPLVLGASFVGLCLVLRAEQRGRRGR
jgi:hypothetical protein